MACHTRTVFDMWVDVFHSFYSWCAGIFTSYTSIWNKNSTLKKLWWKNFYSPITYTLFTLLFTYHMQCVIFIIKSSDHTELKSGSFWTITYQMFIVSQLSYYSLLSNLIRHFFLCSQVLNRIRRITWLSITG